MRPAHEQARYHLPQRSRGPPRYSGARRGLRALRRASRCQRLDGFLYHRHPIRGVHERQGSDALTGAAFTRGARSGVRRPEQVRCHHALRRTEHNLHADGRPRQRGSLLPRTSRHDRRWKAKLDARFAPLPRHVREDGRRVAVCGAPALRRLDGGARTAMTTTNQVSSMSASGPSRNVPTVGQKRLVIVGATGMVGEYALRDALEHPAVGRATSIGRRKLGISHPKLREVLHRDFADCSALAETLSGQDAAVFCLGAYTGAVSDADLRTITVDYAIEFARVLRGSSPNVAFSFLSGSGADPSGRSRMPFARYKGEAEKALLAAGFPHVYLFRPAYIYPVEPRKEPNFSYRLLRAIYPAFELLFPNQVIRADDLARAMVDVAVQGTDRGVKVFEDRDIRAMVKRIHPSTG